MAQPPAGAVGAASATAQVGSSTFTQGGRAAAVVVVIVAAVVGVGGRVVFASATAQNACNVGAACAVSRRHIVWLVPSGMCRERVLLDASLHRLRDALMMPTVCTAQTFLRKRPGNLCCFAIVSARRSRNVKHVSSLRVSRVYYCMHELAERQTHRIAQKCPVVGDHVVPVRTPEPNGRTRLTHEPLLWLLASTHDLPWLKIV